MESSNTILQSEFQDYLTLLNGDGSLWYVVKFGRRDDRHQLVVENCQEGSFILVFESHHAAGVYVEFLDPETFGNGWAIVDVPQNLICEEVANNHTICGIKLLKEIFSWYSFFRMLAFCISLSSIFMISIFLGASNSS